MKKYFISAIVVVLIIVSFVLGYKLSPKDLMGTSFTQNTSSGSYTDGSDLYQNVQATTERMANGSQYAMLQADSKGIMQRVAPSSLVLSGLSLLLPNFTESYETTASLTTNTLATTESNKTIYITTSTPQVLPAPTAGVTYRFVVAGAITTNVTVQTASLDNLIEGTLIVAGAVVDCDAEDTVTFVADGENLGDFFELRSNGTNWFFGASGALTSGKLTCSTST